MIPINHGNLEPSSTVDLPPNLMEALIRAMATAVQGFFRTGDVWKEATPCRPGEYSIGPVDVCLPGQEL